MNISQVLTKLKALIYSKSETDSLLGGKANSSHTHTKSQITDFPSLATVATSGSYSDLSNKPTIPSKTSQLTNDSGFITGVSWANVSGKPSTFTPSSHTHTKSQITDFPSLATVATSGSYNDLSNKPSIPSIDLRPQASADANTVSDGVSITHYGSNGPSTSLGASTDDGALFQQCWSSAWKVQIAADYRNGNLFTRGKNNGTWQPWRAVAYYGDNVSKFTNDSGYITSSGSCNYANSAGYASSAGSAGEVNTSVAAGSTKNLVYAHMADNDQCRIMCGGASNAGYMEIATSDDGNEPIYVRQYNNGTFGAIVRTLTLLDESGNTQFPGTVTAPTFAGNLNGNCSGTAGGVAWSNVSGRPTAVSQFSNDSGFITSSGSCSYSTTSGTSTYSTYLKSLGSQTPKSGRDIFHSGVYTYTTFTDTNTPAHYGAVIGYGNGQGGSCEMFAEWVGRGNLWFRVLRDCIDSWTDWQQIITSDNIGSQSVNYANSAGSAGSVTGPSCINPDSGYYNEGFRFNKSTNGWATITIGTARDTTSGPMNGTGWGIFCDTSDNFIINNFDSSTGNAALYCSDTNTYIPNLYISGGYKIYVG